MASCTDIIMGNEAHTTFCTLVFSAINLLPAYAVRRKKMRQLGQAMEKLLKGIIQSTTKLRQITHFQYWYYALASSFHHWTEHMVGCHLHCAYSVERMERRRRRQRGRTSSGTRTRVTRRSARSQRNHPARWAAGWGGGRNKRHCGAVKPQQRNLWCRWPRTDLAHWRRAAWWTDCISRTPRSE